MLAALGSIIEKDPDYLNTIFKYNSHNNTVEVTFREDEELCTYVLDATKVTSEETNRHTHPAIFFLEKAYALHRTLMGDKNNAKGEQRNFTLSIDGLNENEIISSSTTTFEIIARSFDLALDGGMAPAVFARLGFPADLEAIPDSITLEELKKTFEMPLTLIKEGKNSLGVDERDINRALTQMVNSISLLLKLNPSEKTALADSFLNLINKEDQIREEAVNRIERSLNTLINTSPMALHNNSKNLTEFLTALFSSKTPPLETREIEELGKKIVESIPQKRGLKIYTKDQNEIFDKISTSLKDDKLVTVGTKSTVGTSEKTSKSAGVGEKVSKGLVGSHAMQVVDCYERDGLKFLLIRNPWSHTVRDYHWKEKKLDDQNVHVLSAHAKTNLNSFSLFHHKDKPRNITSIANSARGFDDKTFEQDFKKDGFFELELTDLTKRFDDLTITRNSLTIKNENTTSLRSGLK